jgi:serine/threonine protein phosphatase PrpC
VTIICEDKIYVANLGDSRCLLSENSSKKVYQVTNDHKPELERERIEANGGNVYK